MHKFSATVSYQPNKQEIKGVLAKVFLVQLQPFSVFKAVPECLSHLLLKLNNLKTLKKLIFEKLHFDARQLLLLNNQIVI